MAAMLPGTSSLGNWASISGINFERVSQILLIPDEFNPLRASETKRIIYAPYKHE
jgi:hypothetical protein